jgi:hypothetical protein
MQALRHLNLATVPKVFLTATLVPDHERVLAEWVGISLSRTLVLRSPTTRPNHHLQVVTLPQTGDVFAVGLRLASLLLETWRPDPSIRGVVFVRSITNVEKLRASASFPVYTYHGRMPDEERDANLRTWLSPTSPAKWIIATTALLHGVDCSQVDAIIFVEIPYGLYDYIQGAGRAGRAGQKALVAIIHKPPLPTPFPSNQYACQEAVRTLVTASICRRSTISQVMDGCTTSCADLPGSVLCDVCDGCLAPVITQAMETPPSPVSTPTPTSAPVSTPTPISAPVSTPAPSSLVRRSPPPPLYTTLFNGMSAQVNSQSRTDQAQKAKDLITRFSGCFPCRIAHPEHRPCHDSCERSGISSCSVAPHIPFACTNLPHRHGWIQWRKELPHPTDAWRCYFCILPDSVLTGGQHRSNLPSTVKCRYADPPIMAAWHVLNTPHLLEELKRDLGFVPGPDLFQSFSQWLMAYGSESDDLRLFSVFSWLCKRYYPTAFA